MRGDETHVALVGRGAELAALTGALDRASAGQAGVVLVSGDAGVGKTRLVAELAVIARGQGCMVLFGQCAELGETIPYLPLADALLTASAPAGSAFGAVTGQGNDPGARRRAALRAALRERPILSRLLPDREAPADDSVPELAQQRLFGATLGLLGELAQGNPVLLVFEDLHWADRSTRHLLTFLSRVLQRERVCLVGTYRSDDLHRRHPLRPVVAELLRLPNVSALEVAAFEPDETAEYLASLDGGGRSAAIVDRVHARSEGNPFYAGELLAAARTGDELPSALADLLLSRVERLSETAQQVVRVAAVAGRRVSDELLRRVSGLDEAACGRALREIVSHQVLVPDGADGYAFRHALLREAVAADLLPGEDVRLHAAFAAVLAEAPAERRGVAAELAHHSLAAHDLQTAFAASVRAGREAEAIGAPDEAHEHYDRALSLWDAVPDPETAAGIDRARLLLRDAAASDDSGDVRRAVTKTRRLAALIDPADPLLATEVNERLAYYLGNLGQDAESARIARASIDLLPADPPTWQRARALATYCRTSLFTERHAEIPRLVRETIEAARAAGAAGAEASALVTVGIYTESRGGSQVDELFARARELGRAGGDLQVALRAAFHFTRTKYDRGDLAGAQAAADEDVRFTLGAGLGWSPYGVNLRFMQYLVSYTSGDWARAARMAESFGIRVGRLAEAQISAYALFLEVAQGSDTTDERLRWLQPFWAEDGFLCYTARGLAAEHALWRGAPEEALDHVAAALGTLGPHDPGLIRLATTGLWAYADLTEAGSPAGGGPSEPAAERPNGRPDPDTLITLAREAASYTADGRERGWLGVEGHAWLARAEAEWSRARGDDSPKLWRRSVDAFDYGFDYEVARSRWRLAASLIEQGDRGAGAVEWRRALDAAERLGAAPLLRALGVLGARTRLVRAGQSTDDRHGHPGPLAGLTVREREVLQLVALGRNNREIAADLFISPKTASVHVSNILAKLGVASRTQAAVVAHREGLTGG